MYYRLYKRQSKKLFNIPWEFVAGAETKTFKGCFNIMKKNCEKILKITKQQNKESDIQFSIRTYDKDAWGEMVVFKTKKYNLNLEVIK